MKKNNYFETTITIKVLSDCPIDNYELTEIIEEGETGSFVLKENKRKVSILSGKKIAKKLYDFGSEPSFFQLDDNGKDIF